MKVAEEVGDGFTLWNELRKVLCRVSLAGAYELLVTHKAAELSAFLQGECLLKCQLSAPRRDHSDGGSAWTSASFLAELSVSSPRKIFIFII